MTRMIIHVFHETFIRVLISHFIDISVFHRFSAHACVHSHLDLYHIRGSGLEHNKRVTALMRERGGGGEGERES